MNKELFNYILINQDLWRNMFNIQDRQRKLQLNREQKLRAKIRKQNMKTKLAPIKSD